MNLPSAFTLSLAFLASLAGAQDRRVVVYVSMDQDHSQRILEAFEKKTGIEVAADYDTEDNKTVGMVGKILASRAAPKGDVYWNNEVGQSVRLKHEGLLRPYRSPNAKDIPAHMKDPEGYWTGFAARARVLIYNTEKIRPDQLPRRSVDLTEPRHARNFVMAKPLTGTTLTHVASLYSVWGDQRTDAFLKALRANGVRWERGNAQVAREVSRGTRAFGLTDTDDAWVVKQQNLPIATIFLDQEEGGLGNLVIPNTVMALKGGPNPKEAEALIDFLLSPEVETMLAEGSSAQIPLHPGVPCPAHVVPLDRIRSMKVDFEDVGRQIGPRLEKLDAFFNAPTDESSSGMGLVYAGIALVVIIVVVIAARSTGGGSAAA